MASSLLGHWLSFLTMLMFHGLNIDSAESLPARRVTEDGIPMQDLVPHTAIPDTCLLFWVMSFLLCGILSLKSSGNITIRRVANSEFSFSWSLCWCSEHASALATYSY